MTKTKIFELRESSIKSSTTYLAAEQREQHTHLLEPDAKLIATFVTTSYFDAMRQRNEYLGYEPYRPEPDREDEYRE